MKNSYDVMAWVDNPNFDYSDRRCSGDDKVAVMLLPVLISRGYTFELTGKQDVYIFQIRSRTGDPITRATAYHSISEAVTAAILSAGMRP